jgi:glycosyltransferase involved in cell wall biosynthesis
MKIAFVVNGTPQSAMGHRAHALAERLPAGYELRVFHRVGPKALAVARLLVGLLRFGPQVCYVFDMGYSGVGAASLFKFLTGGRLVIETGDAIAQLATALDRGPLGVSLTRCLEACALRVADRIVVRGSFHQELLRRTGVRADVIQDGVETDRFRPLPGDELRARFGLDGVLTIGLVGSSVWSKRRETCYGWDLVEVIRLLRDRPIAGVMIGDGSGIPVLRERCRRYGIDDKVRFLGHVPYEQLPHRLHLIDVCLSTQTNNLAGRVRTTGKLPLYLACGRYVLASRVGEASLVLPEEMLVHYDGSFDPHYPHKLAERVGRLLDDRTLLRRGLENVATARCRFDYAVLAERVWQVVEAASGHAHRTRRRPTAIMSEARV